MKKYLLIFLIFVLNACSNTEDENYIELDSNLDLQVPSNFPKYYFNTKENPITKFGVELGKKMFYDGRLSSDGTISCGSCHEQSFAFTHHGHSVSHGVGNAIGTRNATPIQNMAFQNSFMWDGATEHLDLQPIIPFTSPIEMNCDFTTVLTMMRNDKEYKRLFDLAFKNKEINSENMLKALGQFMAIMVSSNSKFDKYRRQESGGEFTQIESEGFALFNQKCASCHSGDLQTDQSFRNNGLPINPLVNDIGRFRVTENEQDKYKFKVPSLRNIEKTPPYMHDGRFYTLEAVLEHYANGVKHTQNLDALLINNGTLGVSLTENEKIKIIAFLKTLTDYQFLTDKRFSEF